MMGSMPDPRIFLSRLLFLSSPGINLGASGDVDVDPFLIFLEYALILLASAIVEGWSLEEMVVDA